jgi:hypothetical protein
MRRLSWLVLFAGAAAQDARPPKPVPFAPEQWRAMELESRWVAYSRDTQEDRATRRALWVTFLSEANDFEMLEWLAIYDQDPRVGWSTPTPLAALARADAPQWIRVAAWFAPGALARADLLSARRVERDAPVFVRAPDSHNADEGAKLLADNPHLFLAWFDAWPGGPNAGIRWLADRLREEAAPADSAARYLPPIDPATAILAWLDAPPEPPRLEPDARPDPRRRYVHQVVRAIRGLVGGGIVDPLYLAKLVRLCEHADAEVRREAFLAFTALPARAIPWRRLRALSDDPDADREFAQLAASYGDHPQVFLDLLSRLDQPDHPAWPVALSRLAELGSGFTRDILTERVAKASGVAARELLVQTLTQLNGRLRTTSPDVFASLMRTELERAAWADLSGHPLGQRYGEWVVEFFGAFRGPNGQVVQTASAELVLGYEPEAHLDTPERLARLRDAVRALAKRIDDAIGR